MLFCHLAQARSLREICNGLAASEGKLKHLGVPSAPSRSTLAYANEHRPWALYETVFYELLRKCEAEAVGRKKFRFKNKLVSLDSTSIELCAEIYDWAKYKRTKGAVKLHMVLDNEGYLPCFAVITDGKSHDITVGRTLRFETGTIVAMDKGYVDYNWWKQMTEDGVYFVTRFKQDLKYEVIAEREVPKNSNVRRDVEIKIQPYRQKMELHLRLVTVWNEDKQEELTFLTNHLKFGATTISRIYKERWQIELFFERSTWCTPSDAMEFQGSFAPDRPLVGALAFSVQPRTARRPRCGGSRVRPHKAASPATVSAESFAIPWSP
jgi:hypothetical protein